MDFVSSPFRPLHFRRARDSPLAEVSTGEFASRAPRVSEVKKKRALEKIGPDL